MTNRQLRLLPLWRAIGLLLVVLVVFLSLTPYPIDVPLEDSDKYQHVFAYATLMYWFVQIYPTQRAQLGLAVAFVLMGVGMEFLQSLTDSRSLAALDMLANTLGVGIGWLVAPPRSPHLLCYLERRWVGNS